MTLTKTTTWEIREGDCVEAMAAMPEASVDAVVCDPPYGLEFMGKDWDSLGGRQRPYEPRGEGHANGGILPMYGRGGTSEDRDRFKRRANHAAQEWHEAWAREALRVLKPGGHLLAFGGTRTYHRLACAVEDAGFEIRDTICWMYGSGFPKSLDVSKAIDKAAGVEREVGMPYIHPRDGVPYVGPEQPEARGSSFASGVRSPMVTAPATPDAERWNGWGTALKPAHEPIVVARKPLAGTVAGNVLAHGTGALNVDGCRVGYEAGGSLASNPSLRESIAGGNGGHVIASESERRFSEPHGAGRWPANVVLGHSEDCRQVGTRTVRGDGHFPASRGASGYGDSGLMGQDGLAERQLDSELVGAWECVPDCPVRLLDEQTGELVSGANPTRRRSDKFRTTYGDFTGQEECEPARGVDRGGASRFFYCAKADNAQRHPHGLRNLHPTVKPIELMRWLVRLITPPGGLVLDPFAGSGTTGIAAMREGFSFVGIERETEYAALARHRIRDDAPLLNTPAEIAA